MANKHLHSPCCLYLHMLDISLTSKNSPENFFLHAFKNVLSVPAMISFVFYVNLLV